MKKNCIICGKEFYFFNRDIANNRGKYCSRECWRKAVKEKKETIKCDNCGKTIIHPKWRLDCKPMSHRYCSRKCYGEHRRRFPEKFKYNYGGNVPSIALNLTKDALKKEYIQNGKSIKEIAKEYNCNYSVVSGRILKWKIPTRSSGDYTKRDSHTYWHRFLNKKFNHTCQMCGWNKAVCDIHHKVQPVKGGKNNEENLILLCPNCHRLVHKKITKL